MLNDIELRIPTLLHICKRTRAAVHGEYAEQRENGYDEPNYGVTLDISPDPLQSRRSLRIRGFVPRI